MRSECDRCHGLLIPERMYGEDQWVPIVKCVNCGDVRDREIDHQRWKRKERQPVQHVVAHYDDCQFNVPSSTTHHHHRQISNGNAM